MFCTNCGAKLNAGSDFCTQCGRSTKEAKNKSTETAVKTSSSVEITSSERWWHRLAKVLYYGMHLNLLWMVPLAWSENTPYYSTYSKTYSGSYGEAFWYAFLTLIIYVAVLRTIKLVGLYVIRGEKVNWRKEFTSFF